MKKITYFYALLFAMLIGGGWTNYVWAIDNWQIYSCIPQNGGEYYIYAPKSNKKFFNTPKKVTTSYTPCISADNASQEGENPAILFQVNIKNISGTTITLESIKFKGQSSSTYNKFVNISSTKADYVDSWGVNVDPGDWTLTLIKDHTNFPENEINVEDDKYYPVYYLKQVGANNQYLSPTARTSNSKTYAQIEFKTSLTTANKKTGWVFISKEAYADATATNQYYWTANAVAYTGGSQSSTGGTAKVARTTYQKPSKLDLVDSDYDTSVSGQKGNDAAQPTITVYYKAEAASGYHFVGWFDVESGGSALSENLEYDYSFTATTVGSGNTKTLYARFEEDAAAAAVYTGGSGNPTNHATLGAALEAASDGDLIVLQGNVNVEESVIIDKNITLDFNRYKIQGTTSNLVSVTGDVTFVDNFSGTPGGVTTTGATAVLVNSGSLTINDGTFKAATYAVSQSGSGSVTINNGGFQGGDTQEDTQDISGTVTLKGGFFVHNTGLTAADGYAVSSNVPADAHYDANTYHYMVLNASNPNYLVCTANGQNFSSLEAAIAYANNNSSIEMVILMKDDYVLPAGNYTIPEKTTLLIPYKAEQTNAIGLDRLSTEDVPIGAFRTLTLANGVHIEVYGKIEVSGYQTTGGRTAAGEKGVGRTGGPYYGLMDMKSGSSITLNGGAEMRAWGFVIGDRDASGRYTCEIDVRRGATVYEMFTMMDWKEVAAVVRITKGEGTYHVLPISQYHIQNIEVATLYRPGSRLYGAGAIDIGGVRFSMNNAGVLGIRYNDGEHEDDKAIFLLDNEDESEDTWVRKFYDPSTDQQVYEANNSAYLGSLQMYVYLPGIGQYAGLADDNLNVDSREYQLPITNNFKLHLLSGVMRVTQNTELLPGAVLEIDKKSTLIINGTGYKGQVPTLLLYDSDDWGKYIATAYDNSTYTYGYATRNKYRPGGVPGNNVRDISSAAGLGDAKLIVHGTVDVQGMFKTTEHGATIISTIEDAGTVTISRAGGTGAVSTSDKTYQVSNLAGPTYQPIQRVPALLKNEDDTFASTAQTFAGQSFCFIDFNGDGKGEWKKLITDECFVKDEGNVYYAKPQDYVALTNGKTANDNHTYSTTDDRTLILMDDCQWWEVEPVENHPDLFHCTHPLNDMYYYWDGSKWTEKRYTVTWNDWDGYEYDTYSMKYGVQPKYLGDMPTRAKDAYYTYDFIGWSPEITESTIVTGDITYTAQYARKDVMYTVVWKDEENNVIETDYCKMGQIPVCFNTPDMTNKEWNPAVSAVTGNTTYTLRAKDNVGPYDIKFVNWNGTPIGETQSVAKGALPSTPADPTKPALDDVEFEFAGWSPTVAAATADAVYTATFTEKPITYTITWQNDNGATLGTSKVTPNTVPQYNGTPVRSSDGENYFFAGWTPALAAATADAAYTATYTSKNRIVEDETYEVPEGTNVSIVNLIIRNDGTMEIPSSSTFNANTLTLESDGAEHSGQIIGANKLYLTGDAIFRLEKSMAAATWYAVAVPWTVNINKGIYAGGKRLSVGEFFVIEFDANAYASADRETGTYWNFLDETGKDMQPGKLYMIWLKSAQSAIEFHKTSGNLLTTSTTLSPAAGSILGQSHWNAIANPALFHANLATGAAGEDVLKYNGDDAYIVGSTTNMIVGEPMFVQTATSASVTATRYTGAGMPAYHRAPQTNADNRFVLELTKENQLADRLIVQTAEEKANEYVIGKDLSKMGVSSKVAQMWIERYDAQLCKNTIELLGEQAEYPLSLFAPAAGEYVLSASQERGESVLYLTRNGQPVWNLSYGECVLNVEEGTTNEYGLRIVSSKAPQTATGVGNVQSDGVQCTKELRDGVIYILRGEKVYTIDGQLVK